LLFTNGLGLLVGLSTKWIMVKYKNQENNEKKAYFADASGAGWLGIFGGTQKIYEQLSGKV
jgi:xanthine/uracil/vitamin C permease (AzgA family)